MKHHFCASAIIINPSNKKILLVKHKKFNKWVQPGGHIEENETPEDCALREVYEETGLRIKLIGIRFPREDDFLRPLAIQRNTGGNGELHIDIVYLGVPKNEFENTEKYDKNESYGIKWFSRAELEHFDVFPDIKITFDYLLREVFK